MNYVYILECGDGSLYTGWTKELEKRMEAHSSGKGAKYTRSRLPLKLVYQEECITATEARKREAALKKLSRKEKLLLTENYAELLSLAKEKLMSFQINPEKLLLLREKEKIALFRVEEKSRHYVLKLFLSDYGKEELLYYDLLHKEGITTAPLLKKDQDALLLEDLEHSEDFALAVKEDMQHPQVMKDLGSWYRRLHQINPNEYPEISLSSQWQVFTVEKLEAVDMKYRDKEEWKKFYPLLKEFLEEIKKLPLRLCYNDFYYVNMAVGRDEPLAFMLDYGRMGLNYPGVDLVNALWFSQKKAKEAFREGYGLQWDDEERWTSLLIPLSEFLEGEENPRIFSQEYYKELKCFLWEKKKG